MAAPRILPSLTALHSTASPASGCTHATSLRLTPATIRTDASGLRVIRNLVCARSNTLSIYDVALDEGAEVRRGREGDGGLTGAQTPTTRLLHVRSLDLHGEVTGLSRVRTLETSTDGLHRLLVSFKDAKVRRRRRSTMLIH